MRDNVYQCPLCGTDYYKKEEAEWCKRFHYGKDELEIYECDYTLWDKEPEIIYIKVDGKCIVYEKKREVIW